MTFAPYRSRRAPGEPAPSWLTTPFSEPAVTSPVVVDLAEHVRPRRPAVPLPTFSELAS